MHLRSYLAIWTINGLAVGSYGSNTGLDNQGTEFLIGFMNNRKSNFKPELFVTTSSNSPVNVTVTAPLFSPEKILRSTVIRGQTEKITLTKSLSGVGVEHSNKGVLITATEEITVFGVNMHEDSTDGFVSFPTDSLGTEYILVTWSSDGEFMIIGVTDGTIVNITLPTFVSTNLAVSYNGNTYTNGDVFTVSLDRYNTFHCYQQTGDFTGTKIVANHPVSVFSGAIKAIVSDRMTQTSADHLVEQMIPVSMWGTKFFTISTPGRDIGDYFRIIASEDSTTISVPGHTNRTINATEYIELNVDTGDYKMMTSDKAAMVVMFGKSSKKNDGNNGDPHMTVIPPSPQYSSDYAFTTVKSSTGEFTNYAVVVIDTSMTGELMVDNVLTDNQWTPISGSTNWVTATFKLNPGYHSIYNNDPSATFMAIAFGNAKHNSYAYACGLRMALINAPCNETTTIAGDIVDNDCDGLIDEETNNGIDDDGDGLIDEDLANSPRVNGNWTEWNQWGACSLAYNTTNGTETRERTCTDPAPANNGLDCVGDYSENRSCSIDVLCPESSISTITASSYFKCPCSKWSHLKDKGYSYDELKEIMKPELDELVNNIAVSKKNTSAAIRLRTSASDKRSSSRVIGTGFAAVPIVLVILVVAADISRIWQKRTIIANRLSQIINRVYRLYR